MPYSSLKILVPSPKDSNHPLLDLKRKEVYQKNNIQKRKDKTLPLNFLDLWFSTFSYIYTMNE
jgi:hypothetical protein